MNHQNGQKFHSAGGFFSGNFLLKLSLFFHETQENASLPDRNKFVRRLPMLGWALTFLIIALIAAALGFGGIAGASAGIAQILFVVFLILFVVAMVARAVRGKPPV
jgi:uncharacterized membrane protein YtjA (UPF0391 family)